MRQFDSSGPDAAILGEVELWGWFEMIEVCTVCEGSGLRIVQEGGAHGGAVM